MSLDTPLQVSPLLKLLLMGAGDQYGAGTEGSWTNAGIDPVGRLIVDVGLHDCEAVVSAVRAGFTVHGFEPAPAHMSNCHRKLNRSMFHDAPVHELASGTLAPSDWWATQRAVLQRERGQSKGFAFLYQAALSNASAVGAGFTVGAGGSSSLHTAVKWAKAHGKVDAQRVQVPVLRLDVAVDDDLWLLKIDTEGNTRARAHTLRALALPTRAVVCPRSKALKCPTVRSHRQPRAPRVCVSCACPRWRVRYTRTQAMRAISSPAPRASSRGALSRTSS